MASLVEYKTYNCKTWDQFLPKFWLMMNILTNLIIL